MAQSSLAIGALYASNLWYSVIKKSLASSTPSMQASLGLTAAHIGKFSAWFSLFYGGFKLVGGLMTDVLPATTVYSLGLLLGSLVNLLIPFFPSLDAILVCWSVNGMVQGGGGPALSKVVIEQLPFQHRASIWSLLLVASNIGYLLAPYILLYPLYYAGWQGPFLCAGLVGVGLSAVMLFFPVSGTANSADCSRPSSTPSTEKGNLQEEHSLQERSVVWNGALAIVLTVSDALGYFVNKGVSDWLVQFLMFSSLAFSYSEAISVVFWCEAGSMLGGYFAGQLSDRYRSKSMLFMIAFTAIGCIGFAAMSLATHRAALESGETEDPATWSSDLLTYKQASPAPSPLFVSLANSWLSACNALMQAVSQASEWQWRGTWIPASRRSATWAVLTFVTGFGINGPKALLQLRETEQYLQVVAIQKARWKATEGEKSSGPFVVSTGTISGMAGLCAQIGASGSGLLLSVFVEARFQYLWPSLLLLTGLLWCLLCGCWLLEHFAGRDWPSTRSKED